MASGPEVPMNVEQLDQISVSTLETDPDAHCVPTQRAVLEELFKLLEDYAPTWYTEEHHNRAVAALLGREY
jgi:hypothetical protein